MKKLAISILVVACCTLTGCGKKPGSAQANDAAGAMGVNGGNGAAQSYGMGMSGGINGTNSTYAMVQNRMVAPSNQTYYFAFDKNNVRPYDMPYIQQQAKYIFNHSNAKVRLEGNTDNRGSREYNIGLGLRRAQAVSRILQQEGVRPSQIDIVSYGKEKPAVDGNNVQAWRLNRRVNLVYEEK